MGKVLFIVMFVFFEHSLMAQSPQNAHVAGDSLSYKVQMGSSLFFSTDSLTRKAKRKLERSEVRKPKAEVKLARLSPRYKASELTQQAQHTLDSVNPINKVNSMATRLESLTLEERTSRYEIRLDSMRSRLTSKIDSLTRLPNPDRFLVKSLDSLRNGLDSLKSSGLVTELQGLGEKANQAQSKLNEKLKAWQGKVNAKLSPLNEHGANMGGVNLQGVSLPNAGVSLPISGPSFSMPSTGFNPDIDIDLPTNLPETDLPGNPLLPSVKPPTTSLPSMGGVDKKLGSLNDVSTQVNGYTKDAKELASGNLEKMEQLPKNLEEKAMELDVVEGAQKEMTEGINYAEMMKKWNSDPDVARELALNKAKQEATSHFAGHEEELKAAMQQLAKLKAKKPDAEGVIDLFKPRQNDLKGKPFKERLVPGLSLQFQNSTNQWFDFNLYLGYRISGKITAGAGWVERISENLKEWEYHPEERAYGPRVFGEFKIKGGLHARAEAEYLNAQVTSPYLKQQDVTGRAWVWSYFAGMKQSFNYSKSLKGNVQVMYNLYNPEKRSPYVSRLNVRIGIEIPMKKPAAEKITTH